MIEAIETGLNPPSYPARPTKGGVPMGIAWKKMNHDDVLYTPKYNGWRVLLHVPTGMCYNRQLERLTIAEEFKDAIYTIQKCCPEDIEWLDCEGLERRHGIGRGTLMVLDFIPTPVVQHEALDISYEDRQSVLAVAMHKLPIKEHYSKPDNDSAYLVPTFDRHDVELVNNELQHLNEKWDAEFYEGWVGVKAKSKYPIQLVNAEKKASTWMKHRWDS